VTKDRSSWKKSDPNRKSRFSWGNFNRPRQVNVHFDNFERILLGSIMIFLVLMGGAAIYFYSTPGLGIPGSANCIPPYQFVNGICKPDPFSVVWNGQIPTSVNTDVPHLDSSILGGGTGCSGVCTSGGQSVTIGDFVFVHAFCPGAGLPSLPTDSQGDTFTLDLNMLSGNSRLWHTTAASTSGSYTVTINTGAGCVVNSNPTLQFSVDAFFGATGFGVRSSAPQFNSGVCLGGSSSTCTTLAAGVGTGSPTVTLNVNAGDTLIAVCMEHGGNFNGFAPNPCTASDTQGNGYSTISDTESTSGSNDIHSTALGTLSAATTGSDTVTVNFNECCSNPSNTYQRTIYVLDYSNVLSWGSCKIVVVCPGSTPFATANSANGVTASTALGTISSSTLVATFQSFLTTATSLTQTAGTPSATKNFNPSGGFGTIAVWNAVPVALHGTTETFTWSNSQVMNIASVELDGSAGVIGHNIDFAGGTCVTSCGDNAVINGLVNSFVYEGMDVSGNSSSCAGPNFSMANGQTVLQTFTGQHNIGNECDKGISAYTLSNAFLGNNQYEIDFSMTAAQANSNWDHWAIVLDKSNLPLGKCGITYNCVNSFVHNGFIVTQPSGNVSATALSAGSVSLATGVGKALAFAQAFSLFSGTFNQGTTFAWFLRQNSTVPTEANYDPLLDTNIVFLVYGIKVGVGDKVNFYVYMQRQAGQNPIQGGSRDPYPVCSYASTLFRCMQVSINTGISGSNGDNFVGNYTGGQNGSKTAGNSYWCGGSIASGIDTCQVGGVGYIADQNQGAISYAGFQFNQTLYPWANIQSQYNVGFWEQNSGNNPQGNANNPISWVTGVNSNGAIISVYLPPAQTTPSTVDSGGFFGWLGRSFSAGVKIVSGWVASAGNWVQDTALGPIAQAIQSVLQWFINQLISFFNLVGGILGFPNMGTNLFAFVAQLVTFIVNVGSNIGGWITNSFSYIFGIISLVIAISTAAFVTVLINYIGGTLLSLINIVLTIIAIFFSYSVPVTYLLMMDWIWGTVEVWRGGVPAWLGWIRLNIFIFTFSFKLIYAMVKFLWRIIVIIKSFIPTEGGTPTAEDAPIPGAGGVG